MTLTVALEICPKMGNRPNGYNDLKRCNVLEITFILPHIQFTLNCINLIFTEFDKNELYRLVVKANLVCEKSEIESGQAKFNVEVFGLSAKNEAKCSG